MNRTNYISVKKLIVFLFFAFISFGLKAQKKVVGNYGSTVTEECSLFFHYYFYDDSTFVSYSANGASGAGKYKIYNDSIFLHYEKIKPLKDELWVNSSSNNGYTIKMYNQITATPTRYVRQGLFAIINGEKHKLEISGICEIDSIKNLKNNDSIKISIIQEYESWIDQETYAVHDTFVSNIIFSESISSSELKEGNKEILIGATWLNRGRWVILVCTIPEGFTEKAKLLKKSDAEWELTGQGIGFYNCPELRKEIKNRKKE